MSREQPNDSTIDFTPRLVADSAWADGDGADDPLSLVEVASGRRWLLTGGEAVIGRHSSCPIQLDAPDVSRKHGRVFRRAGTWWISDCHSLNGIYVNGRKVTLAPLHADDEIQIGERLLRVVSGKPSSDPAREVWRSIASALAQSEMPLTSRRAS